MRNATNGKNGHQVALKIKNMLRFHAVHGANVHLDLDAQKASRAPDSFCDGITFR